MKIVLVLANGGPGGMQRQVALLANGLGAAGHAATVVVGGHGSVGGLDLNSVHLIRVPPFKGRSGGLGFLRALRNVISHVQPDVLHGHGLRLALALRFARRATPRVLVTSHGIDPQHSASLGLPLRLSGVAVAACGEAPQRLLGELGIPSILLPVGIEEAPMPKSRQELTKHFGIDEHARVAISAIRLSDQKDPLTMIEAVAMVEDLHLVLFGEGPLLEKTRTLAHTLGAEGRVHFAGYSTQARAWMAASDVVILSSRWEGHVLVALEAMAAKVPLVATECPGIAEWVHGGTSGLLSPVGDAKGLSKNLRRVLHDDVLAANLVVEGTRLAEQHTSAAMVDAHLSAYGVSAAETSRHDH